MLPESLVCVMLKDCLCCANAMYVVSMCCVDSVSKVDLVLIEFCVCTDSALDDGHIITSLSTVN